MSVPRARFLARRDIDQAAGRARLRYITEVPGQQAVYMLKLQEARALLLDSESTPGPHLVAEATATGSTAYAVAQMVAATAAGWNLVLSPSIEGARLGGKASLAAAVGETDAQTLELIETARLAAIAALDAL